MNVDSKTIYIIAGEPSGDFIGSKLIKSLKALNPNLKIIGIGGFLMEKEGIKSLFNIKHISIMGFLEIVPRIFKILRLIKATIQDIKKHKPSVLITIDSPGFNLKVAKEVKKIFGSNIKLIHYVAPSVWAYKPKRANKFAKIFNYLFCLLPFEPTYFDKVGLKSFFVGHPIIESEIANLVKKENILNSNFNNFSQVKTNFNSQLISSTKKNKIVLLPGSRVKEITRLLPIFLKVATLITNKHPHLQITISTIPVVYNVVKNLCANYENIKITQTNSEKYQTFLESYLAIAASGTVTLELALAKVRTVVAYKLNFLSTLLVYLMIKIKWVSLINIMAKKTIYPEVLGYECTVNNLFNATNDLMNKDLNKEEIDKILYELGYNHFTPSAKASKLVIDIMCGKFSNCRD